MPDTTHAAAVITAAHTRVEIIGARSDGRLRRNFVGAGTGSGSTSTAMAGAGIQST